MWNLRRKAPDRGELTHWSHQEMSVWQCTCVHNSLLDAWFSLHFQLTVSTEERYVVMFSSDKWGWPWQRQSTSTKARVPCFSCLSYHLTGLWWKKQHIFAYSNILSFKGINVALNEFCPWPNGLWNLIWINWSSQVHFERNDSLFKTLCTWHKEESILTQNHTLFLSLFYSLTHTHTTFSIYLSKCSCSSLHFTFQKEKNVSKNIDTDSPSSPTLQGQKTFDSYN